MVALDHGRVARGEAWYDRLRTAIEDLNHLPYRMAPLNLAPYSMKVRRRLEALPYAVRQRVVGDDLLWFTVIEPQDQVVVLVLWPARRRRRPDALLPRDLSVFEE